MTSQARSNHFLWAIYPQMYLDKVYLDSKILIAFVGYDDSYKNGHFVLVHYDYDGPSETPGTYYWEIDYCI